MFVMQKLNQIIIQLIMSFFIQHIFPEIRDRHSNLKDNDYLLFPNTKDRKSLKYKTGKLFVKFYKN